MYSKRYDKSALHGVVQQIAINGYACNACSSEIVEVHLIWRIFIFSIGWSCAGTIGQDRQLRTDDRKILKVGCCGPRERNACLAANLRFLGLQFKCICMCNKVV
jgi:hypothetical protein